LGTPSDHRQHTFFGIVVDQLIFRRPGEPDVSVFLVSDRLIAKRVGRRVPVDLFHITLPSAPDGTSEGSVKEAVQVGMKASDVQALSGAAKLEVPYRFNGQPAKHAIYRTQPGGSFVDLTLVDDVITELADIGQLPDDDIFQGR
jgi:hypothetical protein